MSDIAIRVENLSKRYRIGLKEEIDDTFVGAITSVIRNPFKNLRNLRRLSNFDENGEAAEDVIWALKDVSFEVKRGEALGIIGRNGAGKSTLLKILSKITYPTTGRVELFGRVASLLEVGTGFHPELSGRENIYLNGTILGMTKKEIDRKLEEIIDFSGVEKFIDTPVKRFSSGMRVRLAFSVAAHLEPEILLIDEVLAVGDVEFQRKCLGKMDEVARGGRTVVFVSHNMGAIRSICDRGVLLKNGRTSSTGAVAKVIKDYLQREMVRGFEEIRQRKDREGNGVFRFGEVNFLDAQEKRIINPQHGKDLIVELVIDKNQPITKSDLGMIKLLFKDAHENPMFMCWSRVSHGTDIGFLSGEKVFCRIKKLPLLPGSYAIDIVGKLNYELADHIQNAVEFVVEEGGYFGTGKTNHISGGNLVVDHEWKVLDL